MRILLSMDGIKNMDQLYTWTIEPSEEFGDIRVEHYHGDDYCKNIVADGVCVAKTRIDVPIGRG